ncbi:MAG: hypothetical protein OXU79_16575 [Gemmatimonadota bacterium]|nr:hypothetical protein [Gemmatimonadota bacterium]
MVELKAGVAEVNITPPIGISLCGFGNRKGPADTVYDDLFARALVLDDGRTRLAIVTSDLISFAPDVVQRLRDLVERVAGVPGQGLLLNGSHSHSGPTVMSFRSMGSRDVAYEDVLCRQVAGAVRMAADRLEPVLLRIGRAPVRIAHNRRARRNGRMTIGHNPGGAEAPWVDVLRIDARSGPMLGLLYMTAAHPVNLRGLAFSAEFPGYAARAIRRELDGAVPMFAQGCCGDVNCTPMDGALQTTVRLGELLGGAAVNAARHAEPLQSNVLGLARQVVYLPTRIPSVDEAERALEDQKTRVREAERDPDATDYLIRQYRGQIEWAEDYLRAARSGRPRPQAFEIQAMRIGEAAMVAYPGEMFVDYQLEMDRTSPFKKTFTLAYSNGCIGYVPTAKAFPEGGYEVDHAFRYYGTLMITSACERMIKSATLELLEGLKRGN